MTNLSRPVQAPLHEDLIFDVGMHQGEDTWYYLRKGYRVVGFEADPDLVAHNEKRFSDEIAAKRVVIVSGAISSSGDISVPFYRHPSKTVWGTTATDWAERNAHRGDSMRVDVPVVDFAAILQRYGVPWFVKIDIEGADRLCLEVLASFEARPAYVSIESEKANWAALQEELDLLQKLGFNRFAAVQQEGLHRKSPVTLHDRAGRVFTHAFEEHSSGVFGADVHGWSSRNAVERTYRRIFREYRTIGDRSHLHRSKVGFVLLKGLARLFGRPLPGWYDTHAARGATFAS